MVVKVGKEETSIACSDCHRENVVRHNALGEKETLENSPKAIKTINYPRGRREDKEPSCPRNNLTRVCVPSSKIEKKCSKSVQLAATL